MMSENRNCQSCQQNFVIEPEDFQFYARMEVPPPTWCPECRMRRRMAFINERTFFQATCALCKERTLSIIDPAVHKTIYCSKCWWSEKWDPMSYGREYDFSKPFFQQFHELYAEFPELASAVTWANNVNSPYINMSNFMKNCYLVFQSDYDEDCLYSGYLETSKNCVDITFGDKLELCYGSIGLGHCYQTFFSVNCDECHDVWFSRDLTDCANCFGCIGLRHKKYCFFNEQLTQQEYEEKLRAINTGSWNTLQEMQQRAEKLFLKFPRRFMMGFGNENVTGDSLFRCKNAHDCFQSVNIQDCKYCQFMYFMTTKDAYDVTMWGGGEKQYECAAIGEPQHNIKFSFILGGQMTNAEFTWLSVLGGDDLFGCIGLQKKRYCILNKQYTKEEYEALVPRIKKHMDEMPFVDAKGRIFRYGEFFPLEHAPCAYNDSVGQIYLPLTKREALERGYLWREETKKLHKPTLTAAQLPDAIDTVPDTIVSEVIACAHGGTCIDQCAAAFKIIPQELEFYRKMKLPLPRLCPNCRNKERLKNKLPMRLWQRSCACDRVGHFHGTKKCVTAFATAYAPERTELVYCEECYRNEVT